MDEKKRKDQNDPEQRKWDEAGPDRATGRTGGPGGEAYNEGRSEQDDRGKNYESDIRKGPLGVRDDRDRDTQKGMAESLGGPGAGTNDPSTENERRFGGSHTAGTSVKKPEDSEWKGGTPSQGPTTGGMGSAGGGHDTDESDAWKDKDRNKT